MNELSAVNVGSQAPVPVRHRRHYLLAAYTAIPGVCGQGSLQAPSQRLWSGRDRGSNPERIGWRREVYPPREIPANEKW